MNFKIYTFLLFHVLLGCIFGTNYKVGPGKQFTELGSVPWLTLEPGDSVLIYWRSQPYASKIFIRVSGTEEKPIVIKGIPNGNGDLPIITGKNATTNSQFKEYFSSEWTEDLGLFLIGRNERVHPEDEESYKPSYIIFEYLELTGAYKNNTFTDQYGNVRHYNKFCSAIHALISDNLTIRHCNIHDNGQAIFTNSYGGNEGEVSRNTLIEYNKIWNNGGPEDDFTHNIYIQSAGSVIQYNFFGSPRSGSLCANIKDRSSGTVIRYNWIEGAAYLIDLVETEDAQEIIMNEPNYHDVYVYGNILLNNVSSEIFAASLIHYGYDNSPDLAKRGTLYFYNNTVFIQGSEDDWWNTSLFFIPDDFDTSTREGSIAMYNNIVHKLGTTHLQLMREAGTLNLYANNWIQAGYEDTGDEAAATVNYATQPIVGNNPGFADLKTENFYLTDSSDCIDKAGELPNNITTNFPLNKEYVKHASKKERQINGSTFDLGAFENYGSVSEIYELNPTKNKFNLMQNYPNPFNPTTTIKYTIPSLETLHATSQRVRLKVYNILGKEVATLVNEKQAPGNYNVTWNASNQSNGIYFYKLQSGNFTEVRKMVLLK